MKSSLHFGLVALALSAIALASCRNATSQPPIPNGSNVREQVSLPESAGPSLNSATPHPTACPLAALPSTYTIVVAPGNVKGTTFTTSNAIWERAEYFPNVHPTPTATPTPLHQEFYFYFGTYTLKHLNVEQPTACAVLYTTVNGAKILLTQFNANESNAPRFSRQVTAKLLGVGPVKFLTVTGLSAHGGTGRFTLSNGDTGTITLTRRITYP